MPCEEVEAAEVVVLRSGRGVVSCLLFMGGCVEGLCQCLPFPIPMLRLSVHLRVAVGLFAVGRPRCLDPRGGSLDLVSWESCLRFGTFCCLTVKNTQDIRELSEFGDLYGE